MIVVDIEASGLDPARHAILSIGAVDMADADRQFYGECRLPEGAAVSDEALEVNGFSKEQIMDENKPTLRQLMEDFIRWIKKSEDRTIAGQNVWFDIAMLREAVIQTKMIYEFGHRIVDLHTLVYAHLREAGVEIPLKDDTSAVNSHYICEYVGIPQEADPHIALTGAKWEAEAFSRIMYGRVCLPEFAEHPLPEHLQKTT